MLSMNESWTRGPSSRFSPGGGSAFEAMTTSDAPATVLRSADPIRRSLAPFPYSLEVSIKTKPSSSARETVAIARGSSTSYPYRPGEPPSGLVPIHTAGTNGPFAPSFLRLMYLILDDCVVRQCCSPGRLGQWGVARRFRRTGSRQSLTAATAAIASCDCAVGSVTRETECPTPAGPPMAPRPGPGAPVVQ